MSGARLVCGLLVACVATGCQTTNHRAQSIPEQRVPKAKDRAEAERVLAMWDARGVKGRDLAERGDYRGAMAELEVALRLVTQFHISDEGATFNEAYVALERVPDKQKPDLLLQLLADEDLVETKYAVILAAQDYLDLDAKGREQLEAIPRSHQVEVLKDLLAQKSRSN